MGLSVSQKNQKLIPPRASVLVESLRDVGYSLRTAVADIVDNSITAGARNIQLLADTHSNPSLGILDDGCGMTESELIEAMRPGSKNPKDVRLSSDLGRFGLGLKTSSFSQCRRMTVVTRQDGRTACAVWDLDDVASADDWVVDFPSSLEAIPWVDEMSTRGTLVVWQKLDRLTAEGDQGQEFVSLLDETCRHLELVFHRYLEGESGLSKVSMSMNGRALIPHDPFCSRNNATERGPTEKFRVGKSEIEYQPFTLPHHKKVSIADWEKYAGPEGYIKNQGFYVYREKRLIIYGTWFNLTRQTELTKLARVRIDIPNSMDAEWKVDVKKASAQLPPSVKKRLSKLVEGITGSSKRVYTARGARLRETDLNPVWSRRQDKNQIEYEVNIEHPVLKGLLQKLPNQIAGDFRVFLRVISSALPLESLYADFGSGPYEVVGAGTDDTGLLEAVETSYRILVEEGYKDEEVRSMLRSADPWRSHWPMVEHHINAITGFSNE